jgi:hypothetical protein
MAPQAVFPAPPYQPQTPGQDYKYEYVSTSDAPPSRPVTQQTMSPTAGPPQVPSQFVAKTGQLPPPAPQPQPTYHPAPHHQQFSTQPHILQSSHQYQAVPTAEKSPHLTPSLSAQAGPIEASYFPEKSASYMESIPKLGQEPLVSSEPSSSEESPALSLEDEIAFLKFKLLQLELEKRGESVEVPPLMIVKSEAQAVTSNVKDHGQDSVTDVVNPQTSGSLQQQSKPRLVLSPPLTSQSSHRQNCPLVPASPALPSRPLSISQPIIYPPPPSSPALPPRPSSNAAVHYAPPPPPPITTYNPQNYCPSPSQQHYPPPPKSPNLQQPQYQRHDSGYYSGTPTPLSAQQYQPSSQHIPVQSTLPQYSHGRNASQVSLSPMSPAPPPYFPPPPGGKDYFSQNCSQPQQGYSPVPTQQYQGGQSWQWGVAPAATVPLAQKAGEPYYGPPPPIPPNWRSS